MSDRLPSGVLVGAMLRRVNDAGGFATVLARGDAQAGAILVVAAVKGVPVGVLERGIGATGTVELIESGPRAGDPQAITEYWQRRRLRDRDLWVIELDIPSAERFAAETILAN